MPRILLSMRAYAAHRRERGLIGGTHQAVSLAAKAGRITLIDGKVDPEVADIQWAEKTDAVQQLRGANGGHPPAAGSMGKGGADSSSPHDGEGDQQGYWAAKRRREQAEAKNAELDLEERLGILVRRDEVNRGASSTASTVIQHHDAIVERIPAEFGTDAAMRAKMRRRLREEFDRIRDEFARAAGLQVQ
jgi:hypothetical protein